MRLSTLPSAQEHGSSTDSTPPANTSQFLPVLLFFLTPMASEPQSIPAKHLIAGNVPSAQYCCSGFAQMHYWCHFSHILWSQISAKCHKTSSCNGHQRFSEDTAPFCCQNSRRWELWPVERRFGWAVPGLMLGFQHTKDRPHMRRL